jgi:hypothetical protein
MSDDRNLNERGNVAGEFTQGVGGWAEYTVHMTATSDTVRHDVTVPPGKVIPVIFLPGVMGSNLRMSKKRQDELKRDDNRAWRPDDMVSLAGIADVVGGNGLGNWFKNASPAQRQLVFDPNETEVEYYHYTESKGRFDPEGKETLAADVRHQNVPDSLGPIAPLMGQRLTQIIAPAVRGVAPRKRGSPAQVARWRGWSEVLFAGAYGQMLQTAERSLNNMFVKEKLNETWKPVCADPREFGASSGNALTEAELRKISQCWYPVHAMGYNFLKSNGETALVIAERIRGLIRGYQKRGFKCNEVIVITHSMGGLLGRALIHPGYGNLLNDKEVKVLGMYHNVMPTMGAASAYKRMRFGFLEGEGTIAEMQAKIFGIDGRHATAILANTPAPLELLPGAAYGEDWLKVVDGAGKVISSWPRGGNSTALSGIYLQPPKAWWRLINPQWVNPAQVPEDVGGGVANVRERIKDAADFHRSIESTFHPTDCYASFCASHENPSYEEIVFKVPANEIWNARNVALPPPETWQLIDDDARGNLVVQAGSRTLNLKLQPPASPGDETVPAHRSAKKIVGTLFVHGEKKSKGYEHQNSYSDTQVLKSMLYSIARIAKSARWD